MTFRIGVPVKSVVRGELRELPVPLDPPEGRVVDGRDLRLQRSEAEGGALDQDEGGDRHKRQRAGRDDHRRDVVDAIDRRRPAEHETPKNTISQREATSPTIEAMLSQVLRTSRRLRSFSPIEASISRSRAEARGISKAGEPSRPTFSRTGPSIGAITLVREQHVVADPRAGGHVDHGAEEVVRADAAASRGGRRGSTSTGCRASARRRPPCCRRPSTGTGLSWPCSLPKFEPVSSPRRELPADQAQIRLDEDAVAEHQVEEGRVADDPHDLLQGVMEAVERIDACPREEEVGEPRNGRHRHEPADQRAERHDERGRSRRSAARRTTALERPERERVVAFGQARAQVDHDGLGQRAGDGEDEGEPAAR